MYVVFSCKDNTLNLHISQSINQYLSRTNLAFSRGVENCGLGLNAVENFPNFETSQALEGFSEALFLKT